MRTSCGPGSSALGTRVSEGLATVGYPDCRGAVMAGEAKWCRSLPDWIAAYDGWLRRMDPQDVADLSIFLDFRLVRGDAALVGELRRHVHATPARAAGRAVPAGAQRPAFRPPLRLPGNIYLGGAPESSGRFDLKDALQPIVAFARVYAERQRIVATHTMDRIAALADRDLLPAGSREEIADAYDFLMGLRLQTQLGGHPCRPRADLGGGAVLADVAPARAAARLVRRHRRRPEDRRTRVPRGRLATRTPSGRRRHGQHVGWTFWPWTR